MISILSMRWHRIDTPGHDSCQLWQTSSGWCLQGTASFQTATVPITLHYTIYCDAQWETLEGRIYGRIGQRYLSYTIVRQRRAWVLNGVEQPGLHHLHDLDLSFTPATNLLQLRRVLLPQDETVALPVAWFDLEGGTLLELPQFYTRQGPRTVQYAAPSVGYEGLLTLTSEDFIHTYPTLWQADPRR